MARRKKALIFVVAITFALVFVALLGRANYVIDSFQIQVSIAFSDFGVSEFQIPPLGVIRARTHFSPLRLLVSLQGVDLEGLRDFIFSGLSQEEIYARFLHPARKVMLVFSVRILLVAALGGSLGVFILGCRHWSSILMGSALGLVVALLLLVLTFATFTPTGFANLEYQGMLQAAPWMVALFQEAFVGVKTMAEHIQVMSINLYSLLQKVEDLGQVDLAGIDLKVLHVSDIHNNPVALDLVERVVNTFAVDFVIDTGDITDFGSPLEVGLLSRLDDWPVPYVIALGNHDSPAIAKHLATVPAVTLLKGEMVEIAGLKILGVSDPAAQREVMTTAEPGEMEAAVAQLKELLASAEEPDLLAVHEQRMAMPFAGKVPVILHGHSHSPRIQEIDGSVVIDAGTCGAAGIRGLQSTDEIPYSLVLLHFSMGEDGWRLVAADTISLYYRQAGFGFRRTIFSAPGEGDETEDDATFPGP
ncbi:MAG: metallophosphoesterase family protein [bacterium]|jgi:Icc-related predicted phosphoesterase